MQECLGVVFLNKELVETFFTKHLPEYKNILQNEPLK